MPCCAAQPWASDVLPFEGTVHGLCCTLCQGLTLPCGLSMRPVTVVIPGFCKRPPLGLKSRAEKRPKNARSTGKKESVQAPCSTKTGNRGWQLHRSNASGTHMPPSQYCTTTRSYNMALCSPPKLWRENERGRGRRPPSPSPIRHPCGIANRAPDKALSAGSINT